MSQHRHHGPHRCRQDDDDRAHPVLHGHHLQDRRGARRHRGDGLDGAGAGARDHDHVRRDDLHVARHRDQHHRHARPRRLHRRSRALAARAGRRLRRVRRRVAASSRSRRRCGARRTSTACRASASSTRWTASAPTSRRRSTRSRPSCRPTRWRSSCPIGSEDKFKGVVDLVQMKAITYKDETMGADYDRRGHPGRHAGRGAKVYREKLIEKVSEVDDQILEKYLGGEEITEEEIKAALRKRVINSVRDEKAPFSSSSAARRSRTRACSRCSTRSSTTCRRRSTSRRSRALDASKAERADHAPGQRRRAVRGAGVQDHDRPVRRPARPSSASTRAC